MQNTRACCHRAACALQAKSIRGRLQAPASRRASSAVQNAASRRFPRRVVLAVSARRCACGGSYGSPRWCSRCPADAVALRRRCGLGDRLPSAVVASEWRRATPSGDHASAGAAPWRSRARLLLRRALRSACACPLAQMLAANRASRRSAAVAPRNAPAAAGLPCPLYAYGSAAAHAAAPSYIV